MHSTTPIGGTIGSDSDLLWVGGPFSISFEPVQPSTYNFGEEGDDLQRVSEAIGYLPTQEIVVSSWSKNKINHQILGEIVLFLARSLGGHIDFNGAVISETFGVASFGSSKTGQSELMSSKMPGKLYRFSSKASYENSSYDEDEWQVCDVEFMENWLMNEHFHMIK